MGKCNNTLDFDKQIKFTGKAKVNACRNEG